MFKEHIACKAPEKESIKVWRYMDFTKFVSILSSGSLYFPLPGSFDDPYEGSLTRSHQLNAEIFPYFAMGEMIKSGIKPGSLESRFRDAANLMREEFKFDKQRVAINCWHMNHHESAAMWSLYLHGNEGIAIQSSYRKLRDSFIDDEDIHIGEVNYIDYESEWFELAVKLNPFLHKRKSFEHEKELRAIVYKKNRSSDISKPTIKSGISVKVDLNQLVENIYIAPGAPAWFLPLVESVITQYEYKFNIQKSSLNDSAIF